MRVWELATEGRLRERKPVPPTVELEMRRMRRAVSIVAACVLPLSGLTGQGPSGLQKALDAELARFPGRAGIWVKHLTTGEEAAVRADESFNSASVIKIHVRVLADELSQ